MKSDSSVLAAIIRYLVAFTVFLGAFLLFQVQPLISKAILPWFGGASSVWTICVLFFQVSLLAGYAYAHACVRWLPPRVWLSVQIALLIAATLALPILPSPIWKPTGDENPTIRILALLVASVGLPFLLLSTTGPLLQAWFGRLQTGRSPYRLYALSNAGSLLALLSYPFIFEVAFALRFQATLWSMAFVAFATSYGACAVLMVLCYERSFTVRASNMPDEQGEQTAERGVVRRETFKWFFLALLPSTILVATTNQVCHDIASVPFLWVLPLAFYLLSFIICFDNERWYSRRLWAALVIVSSLAMVIGLLWDAKMPIVFQIVVFFFGLFAACMFCHGELSRSRPSTRRLTTFYLSIAAGGAAGGVLVGIVAPLVFDAYYEMHAAIVCSIAVVSFSYIRNLQGVNAKRRLAFGLVLLVSLVACTVGLCIDIASDSKYTVHKTRNFYGVLRVKEYDRGTRAHSLALWHGRIVHGDQFITEENCRYPTTYYGPSSGVGLAMRRALDSPRRIGVVGLGIGTLAAYGRKDDLLRFYEINPTVQSIARNWFLYLALCPSTVEVKLGDARLLLERELAAGTHAQFDILVIDAFSSDAIPTHLLTREACEIYLGRLEQDGLLCIHVSNLHFDIVRVVAGLAKEFDLKAKLILDEADATRGALKSTWVVLSRDAGILDARQFAFFKPLQNVEPILWTDDRCNPFEILR